MKYYVEGIVVEDIVCYKCQNELHNSYAFIIYKDKNGLSCDNCSGKDWCPETFRPHDNDLDMVVALPEFKLNYLGDYNCRKLHIASFHGGTLITSVIMPPHKKAITVDNPAFTTFHHHASNTSFTLCFNISCKPKQEGVKLKEKIQSMFHLYLYVQTDCLTTLELYEELSMKEFQRNKRSYIQTEVNYDR